MTGSGINKKYILIAVACFIVTVLVLLFILLNLKKRTAPINYTVAYTPEVAELQSKNTSGSVDVSSEEEVADLFGPKEPEVFMTEEHYEASAVSTFTDAVSSFVSNLFSNSDIKATYTVKNGGSCTSDDLRPLGKYISKCTDGVYLQGYRHFLKPSVKYTVDGVERTWTNCTSTVRTDCSGGVSLMCYLLGMTSTNTKAPSWDYFTWGEDIGATTFADLQVGDILTCSKHIAMVAYIDGDNVYMFDWGSSTKIQKVMAQGWSEVYSKSAPITSWYSGYQIYSRRL